MSQKGFNFQHLSSKEGLTNRARHLHFICPSLSRSIALGRVIARLCGATRLSDSPHSNSLLSSAMFYDKLSAFGTYFVKLHLESLKLSPSIIFAFEPLLFKERWRLRWKDVQLTGPYSVPSNFFTILGPFAQQRIQFSLRYATQFLILVFLEIIPLPCLHAILCFYISLSLRFAGFRCEINSWNSSTFLFSMFSFSLKGLSFLVFELHRYRDHTKSLIVTENIFHGTNYERKFWWTGLRYWEIVLAGYSA